MLRIGMLTSGGDCQALNATMRAVVKGLYNCIDDVEIYGFLEGYKGLMYEQYRVMNEKDFSGIINVGGTILGSSRQPFKYMGVPDANGIDKIDAMINTYNRLELECLIILGGNGTQKTANLLRENGLNVIHLPKTIDNDIAMTDVTFGFQSTVNVAVNTIDSIHTTAASHGRVFVVELMGHKVGWLTLHAGMAGGADVILLPEIPYDISHVVAAIRKRHEAGKNFTIVAVAEGAISKEDSKLDRKEYKAKKKNSPYISIGYEIAARIQGKTGEDVRVMNPGHMQRGGSPSAYDRVLSTRLGAEAAKAVVLRKYGIMIGIQNGKAVHIPLSKVAGELKRINPDSDIIEEAKTIGICFGD